jgi:protein-disulfide isomerase
MTDENQSPEPFETEQIIEEPEQIEPPKKSSGEVTITFRRIHIYAFVMPVIFVVGLGLGFLLRGWVPLPGISETEAVDNQSEQQTSEVAAQPEPQAASETTQVVRYEIPIDDDPMIGPEDAPITIVEFSDYECPYCQRWHTEVFEQLLETYPNEVRLVYRDFPLTSIHPNAIPAAIAANCAREQDAFWDYHDKLFGMELGLNTEAYQEYASQLDIDTEEFNECLDSGRYEEEVQADFDFAANLGVRSTPTFFINGIAVVGAQPFEVFQQVIEQELAGEIP